MSKYTTTTITQIHEIKQNENQTRVSLSLHFY